MVQAANTYWSTRTAGGWYGGYEKLLRQEIANIGPGICLVCPSAEQDDDLSQDQLYQRMDLTFALGVTDFTFFEIANKGAFRARYMDVIAYFRSGKKGLVLPAD